MQRHPQRRDCRLASNCASHKLLVGLGCLVLTVVSGSSMVAADEHGGREIQRTKDSALVYDVAPMWPFQGVISETGMFWNIAEGSVSSVQLGQLEHCRIGQEPEVEYDEQFVYFSNTVSYSQDNEVVGTYVVPWGDRAYPLMTNPAMTRKTIGQLPGRSVRDWRIERSEAFDAGGEAFVYGSTATINIAADPEFAQNHLVYMARDYVEHLVLKHTPQHASLPLGAMSLHEIGMDQLDALQVQAEEYRIRRAEEERRLLEDDGYDPHAGPAAVLGPWISGLDGVHVHWDALHTGFWWCDQRYGFVLDAATGEFVGCFEGELLEVWQSKPVLPNAWAAPLGFSADECADSLELWQNDPMEWLLRLAARHQMTMEQHK